MPRSAAANTFIDAANKVSAAAAEPTRANSPEFGADGLSDADIVNSIIEPSDAQNSATGASKSENRDSRRKTTSEDEGATGSNDEPTTDNTDGQSDAGDDGQDAEDEPFDPFSDGQGEQSSDEEDDDDDADDGEAVHSVRIDGKVVKVTLDQLLKNYSGEKAIEGRLQQATEELKIAKQAKADAERELTEARQVRGTDRDRLANALQGLKSILAQPTVKLPDPALQATEPAKYLLQMEHYRQDQARVAEMHALVDNAMKANTDAKAEDLQALRHTESAKLAAAIPALRDEKLAPKTIEVMMKGAAAAGFTAEEVKMAVDHRLFVMATKAGLYDQMMAQAKGKGKVVEPPQRAGKAATGGPSGSAAGSSGRRMAQKMSRARETGTVEDVAETLIIPKRQVRR